MMNPQKRNCQSTMFLALLMAALVSACAPYQALTREYYKPPALDTSSRPATITGFNDVNGDQSQPVKVFVGAIDEKPVGLPKPARCNFDKLYPVEPGTHTVGLSYTAGPDYIQSLVAYAVISVNFEPGANYIAKGRLREGNIGVIWVENKDTGAVAVEPGEYPLKDNPGKGMPLGFTAISNSCSLP